MTTKRLADFSNIHLYAVTGDISDEKTFLKTLEGLLVGGVDAVQLRSKTLSDRALIEMGKRVRSLCQTYGALFIVNDRVDLAMALQADGVHLGHDNMPISTARELGGHRLIIGASAHSLPQALDAQRNGADYVSCGPIWATPTKPDYDAVGLKLIGLYKATLSVPFVTIGGIDEKNIDEVLNVGARTVAMVRALFDSKNPEEMARMLKNKIINSIGVPA